MRPGVISALVVLGAVLLVAVQLAREGVPPTPQSAANQRFAAQTDYGTALSGLRPVWPPGYPSLLFVARRAGVLPRGVNLALLGIAIALLFPIGRRVAPGVHPGWWAGLYGVAGIHVANLGPLVSEALLVPLALGVLWTALDTVERGRPRDYAALAGLLAAACLTRYFALFWLLPGVGLVLAWQGTLPLRTRLVRAGVTTAAAAIPVLAWMLSVRQRTGFLTGMDRFEPRFDPARTTLAGTTIDTAKTVFLDVFVPAGRATYEAVGPQWSVDPLGLAVAGVAAALVVACVVSTVRVWRLPQREQQTGAGATGPLLAALLLGYFVWLLVLWSAGNNDPIYTRFVYPAHAFLGLGAAHVYARVKAAGAARARLPFQLLYGWLLAIQAAGAALRLAR